MLHKIPQNKLEISLCVRDHGSSPPEPNYTPSYLTKAVAMSH